MTAAAGEEWYGEEDEEVDGGWQGQDDAEDGDEDAAPSPSFLA